MDKESRGSFVWKTRSSIGDADNYKAEEARKCSKHQTPTNKAIN